MSISDSVSKSSEENFDTSATVQQLFSEAVTKDNYEMAKWALLNGADVNKFANYEYISEEENPLMVSISNSNEKWRCCFSKMVRMLIMLMRTE